MRVLHARDAPAGQAGGARAGPRELPAAARRRAAPAGHSLPQDVRADVEKAFTDPEEVEVDMAGTATPSHPRGPARRAARPGGRAQAHARGLADRQPQRLDPDERDAVQAASPDTRAAPSRLLRRASERTVAMVERQALDGGGVFDAHGQRLNAASSRATYMSARRACPGPQDRTSDTTAVLDVPHRVAARFAAGLDRRRPSGDRIEHATAGVRFCAASKASARAPGVPGGRRAASRPTRTLGPASRSAMRLSARLQRSSELVLAGDDRACRAPRSPASPAA